jgi:hypothetical protein
MANIIGQLLLVFPWRGGGRSKLFKALKALMALKALR